MFKVFGKTPTGAALKKVKVSPHFKDGSFKNLITTEMMTGDTSMLKTLWSFLNKPKNTEPSKVIPSIKTDLKNLNADEPTVIWFGHSSYLIHISNKNILVDPVFCGHASPFSFTTKAFVGANIYGVDDMPEIDILILTHDHYDHLDFETVVKLNDKTKAIYTALGVASNLTFWGIDESKITEFDWWDSKQVDDIKIIATPSRHFSGRLFKRGQSLWSSFVLEADGYKIFIGSDSGYDATFKKIGEQFGGFDLAILENGQYNEAWAHIHMMPEETVQSAVDLNAKVLLPVHWGKFTLSLHPWDEPIKRLTAKAVEMGVKTTTPLIGEPIVLNQSYPNKSWWQDVI